MVCAHPSSLASWLTFSLTEVDTAVVVVVTAEAEEATVVVVEATEEVVDTVEEEVVDMEVIHTAATAAAVTEACLDTT